ncbi:uncharacterized protein LOC105665555 [Ceratitis capitata]|uniref:uncharacterized protein LOC105665555 n=1 Tax=Ceratitis capitata TaxID=7213 RepID=UPI0006188CB7|nr:uncharacterized protein LOC105665555 [Ceratitis capitata]
MRYDTYQTKVFPEEPQQQEVINEEMDELLEKECIEPSYGSHSASKVLVENKNGKCRLCVDYCQLNARSILDAYPSRRIQHIPDGLRGAHFISSLDLKNGNWLIPNKESSKQYTPFIVAGLGFSRVSQSLTSMLKKKKKWK